MSEIHLRIATARTALYISALMTKVLAVIVLLFGAGLALLGYSADDPKSNGLWFEGEKHLANIRQLTHGGEIGRAHV